jgi:5-methylcytosine-specific restriction endonuclease McrA
MHNRFNNPDNFHKDLLNHENATADHIVPISNGGNNCQVNLIVCCKDCNAERGNSEFKSFLFIKNKKYKKGNIII